MPLTDSAGAAERLHAYGLHLVTAVRNSDPADYMASLARLDRSELEHLVLLLAAKMPDGLPASPVAVAELVAERFRTSRRHIPRDV